MLQSAIPIFFLMLGAALLGFLICWAWLREKIGQYRNELNQQIHISKKIESEQHNLIAHSNALQAQQKKLINDQRQDQFRLNEMSTTIAHLKHEKELLAEDFKNYKTTVQNNASTGHSSEIDELKNHLLEKEVDISNWKNKHQLLLDIKKESDLIVQKLSDERNKLEASIKSKGKGNKKKTSSQEKKKKWEMKYKTLNLKLLEITRERDELLKKSFSFENVKGKKKLESKESESALDKLKDKFRQWNQADLDPSFQGSEIEIKILNEIFQSKHRINFERIGIARGNEKDDLKLIKGLGPFIEKKFNALGIYRFAQIAKFKDDDIEKINKIMQLEPEDYITKSWIEDAKSRLEAPK